MRAYGFGPPSSRQLLLQAMLRVFAWLVSNVVSLLGMILNHRPRDWHTDAAREDQLPRSNDITQESQLWRPSFAGKADLSAKARRAQAEGRIPSNSVVSTQGTTTHSLCASNQDARHNKAEHDIVGVEAPTIWKRVLRTRAPGGDRDDNNERTHSLTSHGG